MLRLLHLLLLELNRTLLVLLENESNDLGCCVVDVLHGLL